MSRLFLSPKEISWFSDLNKEIIKDIIGHKIYLYHINTDKTQIHDIYREAPEKIFERPVEVNALVQFIPEEVKTTIYGSEEFSKIEVYLHERDILDREIIVEEGDFFSFGPQFFEIVALKTENIIYGMIEYSSGLHIIGREARKGQFETKLLGPTDEQFSDKDATQETFVQQRGLKYNKKGLTNDRRELQQAGVLEQPTQTAEISPRGSQTSPEGKIKSSFYDET